MGDEVRLQRSVTNRCFAGSMIQLFASVFLPFAVFGAIAAPKAGDNVILAAIAVVLLALCVIGFRGNAAFDGRSVRWSYYRQQEIGWSEIEQVTCRIIHFGLNGLRPIVEVRTGSRRHKVLPACGSLSRNSEDFVRALAGEARRRGIAVDSARWRDL